MLGPEVKVGVSSATSWGITLAALMHSAGHRAAVWTRTDEEAALLSARRTHPHLPGFRVPGEIEFNPSPDAVFGDANLAIIAVPSRTLAANLSAVGDALSSAGLIVSATKGLETGAFRRPSEVIAASLEQHGVEEVGVLSGPNLAREVAAGMPGSATVAFKDIALAHRAQAILNTPVFRVYASDDVIGVELGGGLKNIIAIGAGVIDGLGLGDNAKAAFITRGLAEITRLGLAMGAKPETFAGLSGMGDLVATCYSPLSRNRSVGERLAAGELVEQIVADMGQVAEGVHTAAPALSMAESVHVEMPITAVTVQVLAGEIDPREAISRLMMRAPQAEAR